MIEFKNVQGTQETVPEIEFNKDIVYVRNNIRKVEKEDEFTGEMISYNQYDEKQYTYNEWTEINSDFINTLNINNAEQDIFCMELDFKIMALESAIPQEISTLSETQSNNSTYKLLKRMIEQKNYSSKETMANNIERYYQANRITLEDKNKLIELLG